MIIKFVLSGVVLGYAIYRLVRPDRWNLKDDRYAWFFGLTSGLLGGAYNTGGPPIAIYGTLRGWSPLDFRSTMQGFSIMTCGFILAAHAAAGLWSPFVFTTFGWSIPGLVIAVLVGNVIHHRIPRERFDFLLLLLLILVGGVLMVEAGMEIFS